jgi:hypothetical protein
MNMGTRAQFFIGHPSDLENRKYLGTVAWDGYPDGDCGKALANAQDEAGFLAGVQVLKAKRDDFADPAICSFPFPWRDDLYLTDCTYAWFDGATQFTFFHKGFVPLRDYLVYTDQQHELYHEEDDKLPSNVTAPVSDKPAGPDSIMIISINP